MKNIIYFHGIHGDTQKSIAPFLEKEFKVFGYETLYPKFFEDGCATYENFKIQADKLISKNKINNDTIIISHSIGNSFSIRYLFENKLTPFAYISLAGYCDKFPLNDDIVREQIYSALPTKEELNYVKTNIKNRISLYSNDHLIPQELLINSLLSFSTWVQV